MAGKAQASKGSTFGGCLLVVAVFVGGAVAFKACSGSSTASAGSPSSSVLSDEVTAALVLQQFDTDHGNPKRGESDYQHEMATASGKCTNSIKDVTLFVENSYTDLVSHGVTDETALTVLQHLNKSVPDGSTKMDCQSVLAAYLTLREG